MTTIEKIKPGDVLYDVHSERAGNTTVRIQREWKVFVKEVDVENRYAMCSWNGNRPTRYSERKLKKLRMKPATKLNGHFRHCHQSAGLAFGSTCTCEQPPPQK